MRVATQAHPLESPRMSSSGGYLAQQIEGPFPTTFTASILIFVLSGVFLLTGGLIMMMGTRVAGRAGVLFVLGALIVAACGWSIVLGIKILQRRGWARSAGLTTFSLFALLTLPQLILAFTASADRIPGQSSSVLGFFRLFQGVLLLANLGVVGLLLHPLTRRDFDANA